MGDDTSLLAVLSDDDAVRAGRACRRLVVSKRFIAFISTRPELGAEGDCRRGFQHTAAVDSAAGQDGELLVRAAHAVEAESLVVVVLVGVARAAGRLALLVVVAGGVGGIGHGVCRVVVVAAGGAVLTTEERLGSGRGADDGGEEREEGQDELHGG